MVLMMKKFFLLLALAAAPLALSAQNTAGTGIPYDVYYLMPQFANGYVFIRGQAPAKGKLNICAVNNSLRFLGSDGTELEASDPESILKVVIDTVSFIRDNRVFYRMFPVSADMGVALERRVRIVRDEKETGYGGSSQTAAVKEYGALYTDGAIYQFDKDKTYPYEVFEEVCVYKGNIVVPLNKKTLRKLFPARKAEIDAWFKAGYPLPTTVEDAQALLRKWM